MTVRKATKADINAISKIYEHIHKQEQNNNMQVGWLPNVYPIRATAEKSLERDDLFVYEDNGRILASAIINHEQVDIYAHCDWKYKAADDEVMVMHTLVVEPSETSKGIGKIFVEFYENYSRKAGCKVLRIDTNAKNKVARKFYAKLGYSEAAILPCDFNGIPNIRIVLLEKLL